MLTNDFPDKDNMNSEPVWNTIKRKNISIEFCYNVIKKASNGPKTIFKKSHIHTCFAGIKALGPEARARGTSTPCS